jgi:tetratricopeptide (TPR) repeat protein
LSTIEIQSGRMKPVRRVGALALALFGSTILGVPVAVQAQDPCPSASATDAEAGWAAYQAGEMVTAGERFLAALSRCDNDQYSRTGLGYVALREGNTAEASALLLVVIAAEPNNVDALVGLGLARWRSADLDAVREYFTRVIELAPDHPTALEYLDRLAGAEAVAAAPTDAADEAWIAGNTEVALRLYSERLEADPTDRVALLRVALVRAWREQYQPAIELLDLLIELEPGQIDARLARARVRAWSGDIPAAQDEVREVLSLQPENADAMAALALFQSWSGQLDEALASYDELLSIAPEHGAARRQQAQAMAWAARYEQSLAAYDSLVARNPDDIEARLGLANALAFSSDYDAAIEQYDEVLSRDPGHMRALTGRAKTLGWAGRLVDSERAALRAVEIDRTSAEAWGGLGQVYRWQGRNAAAKEALEVAARLAPTNPGVRDQLRSVELALAPLARPTVTAEDDSDGNRMLTTSLTASWHPASRLDVRTRGYYKQLTQTIGAGVLERTAFGVMVSGTYQFRPGWTVAGGVGGSRTDGFGDPSFAAFSAGVRTPDRHSFGVALDVTSNGLDETAALAQRGIRSSAILLTGRWAPGPGWRVDGNVGVGRFDGTEDNGRRGAYLGVSRRLGRFFSLGASFRGFSFEKNLDDGYFDPDFYGIAEVTSYWLYRPVPWTFLIELAPGLQQVTRAGDPGGSLRSNARVAYRIGSGREVSLSFGYSSAGLTSFATGKSGYRYTALILGSNWVF